MDDCVDVPDSTDWLATPLASLMPVEQAFRCHVCKDFYTSPMITSCSHTFCSLCIRRSLAVEGKCPLCRASDQESKLRGNWAMREAVDAFVQSRSAILEFARNPPALEPPRSPKRRVDEVDGVIQDLQDIKRPRMSTRSSKARAAESMATMVQDEIDVSEGEEAMDYAPDDGLVSCPICLTRMKEQQVDRHLDTSCPGSPQPPAQRQPSTGATPANNAKILQSAFHTGSATTKAAERLPTLAYSMMKESVLRKKLADLGISNAGNKQMLERRHREWVMVWNANCDSARPKKRSELLQDLELWERTMGTRAPMASRAANMGAQIKDKDFDGAAWAAKHDASFKDLIANARKSKRQAEQKTKDESSASGSERDESGRVQESGQAETTNLTTGQLTNPVPLYQRGTRQEVVDLTSMSPERSKPLEALPGQKSHFPAPLAPQLSLVQPPANSRDHVFVGALNDIPKLDARDTGRGLG